MWKVFPKLSFLKLLFSIFSALFISVLILYLRPVGDGLSWADFATAFELGGAVTLIFIIVTFVLGKWAWRVLWKIPYLGGVLHKNVCPDLNGKWLGNVHSSFVDEKGNKIVKEVEFNIIADLFGFNLSSNSLDGYQTSKVVHSELYRDSRTNTFYFSYIFESTVLNAKETDDRFFEGAAKLEVVFDEKNTVLKGYYWTNRAWQRGDNTAGEITMQR